MSHHKLENMQIFEKLHLGSCFHNKLLIVAILVGTNYFIEIKNNAILFPFQNIENRSTIEMFLKVHHIICIKSNPCYKFQQTKSSTNSLLIFPFAIDKCNISVAQISVPQTDRWVFTRSIDKAVCLCPVHVAPLDRVHTSRKMVHC